MCLLGHSISSKKELKENRLWRCSADNCLKTLREWYAKTKLDFSILCHLNVTLTDNKKVVFASTSYDSQF